jgi:hypothetical protein
MLISVFTVYCLILLALSFFKSAELFLPFIYQMEDWLGGDKLVHMKLSLVLSFIACIVSREIKKDIKINLTLRLFFMQIVLMIGLLFDEAHQYVMFSRRFEWMDFYYGASGLFIGLLVYCGLLFIRLAYNLAYKPVIKIPPNSTH